MKALIIARLREPSTYAGIAAVIGGLSFSIAPLVGQTVMVVGTAVAGLLAIWLPEKR